MVKDLESLLDADERSRVDAAIVEAEAATCAEIVPVVTDASGDYDRPEDLFALTLALAALAGAWLAFQGVKAGAWSSGHAPALVLDLPVVLGLLLVVFFVGVAVASRSWVIRALFTPRSQMEACLRRGAERAFYLHGLGKTKHGHGVLIYVSLFERMVYVLGDETIREELQDADFEAVRDAILAGFAKGEAAEGLVAGIREAGVRLSEAFPKGDDDEDELPNALILFPQRL